MLFALYSTYSIFEIYWFGSNRGQFNRCSLEDIGISGLNSLSCDSMFIEPVEYTIESFTTTYYILA